MTTARSGVHPSRLLLLDRDGVINVDHHDYVRSWDQFEFLPGVLQALAGLTRAGYRLVVVTNQSAIGRGLVSRAQVDAIHEKMIRCVEQAGGALAGVVMCPHAPEADCTCRKPLPGLVDEARRLVPAADGCVFFVGDQLNDVRAALAGGCRPVLVATGRGAEMRPEVERQYGGQVTYLAGLNDLPQFLQELA